MHFISSVDDPEFHKAAKAVKIHAEDLIPVEGQPGTWRLPIKQRPELMTPEIKRLFLLFKTKKLSAIVQRRAGKRITLVLGPDLLLFSKKTPPVGENQFILSIGLEKLSVPEDTASLTPGEPSLWETLIAVLRQEADIAITLIDQVDTSIDFGVGDMLELDTIETILPKTGYVFGMLMVFKEEDQDMEKEESPPL